MLYKIFLFTIVVLSVTIHEQVLANSLSWKYSVTIRNAQKQASKGTVTFSVNSAITNIEDEKEIITIDYTNNILYRYDKRIERCSGFPLSTSSLSQYSKRNNTLQLSNFRLFSTQKFQKTFRHNCRLKRILFSADSAKFQTVAPPTTNAFGQIFTESLVNYCVSVDITGFNSILAIAKQHSSFFESNQFLRQIDITGLFEILHGFPIQIIKTANHMKTTLSLIDEPQPINDVLIPEQCQ